MKKIELIISDDVAGLQSDLIGKAATGNLYGLADIVLVKLIKALDKNDEVVVLGKENEKS